MINKKIIQIWSCWLLVFVQNVHSSLSQVQFMSFCNQTLPISSSLSIIFAPLSYSSCCNITLQQTSTNISNNHVIVNVNGTFPANMPLKIYNSNMESIDFIKYSTSNRTLIKTDILRLPMVLSLCQFNLPSFEVFIHNISKGPCLSDHYRCSTSNQTLWCIDEIFLCDGYHLCPQGIDGNACPRLVLRTGTSKVKRTISGGIVTTIIIFGLLLIIASVSIAIVFVYFQRKRQRRRQFTYSLESTSDDWEPTGTGYHLFDNWPTNRRNPANNLDNAIIDANEHMPITSTTTNR